MAMMMSSAAANSSIPRTLVFAVYALAMALDEALATPHVGDVLLCGREHPNVVGKSFLGRGEATVKVSMVPDCFLHRLNPLRQHVKATANAGKSDHKSDKQNAGIEDSSHRN
jgi:hypothetical protein